MTTPYRTPSEPDAATGARTSPAMLGFLAALMFAVGVAFGFGSATQTVPPSRIECVCRCAP